MKTEYRACKKLELQGLGKRKKVITNDADAYTDASTSDGGLILLQQMEKKYQIIYHSGRGEMENRIKE